MSEVNSYQMLGYLAERGQVVKQIELYNTLWNDLIDNLQETKLLRDLRINLRQLRSVMLLLSPLLPTEGEEWRNLLKQRYVALGNIREYDVAYQACIKYEAHTEELIVAYNDVRPELQQLKELLEKEYNIKINAWSKTIDKNCIAQEMHLCREILNKNLELSIEDEAKANAFLQARLQLWGIKLYNKLQEMSIDCSAVQLHKLRVKVKRFRDAYAVFMHEAADEELLDSLKEMQDILGSLHDSDRDIEIIDELALDQVTDEALATEVKCFKIWREVKKQQRMEQLVPATARLLSSLKQNVVATELL